MDENSTKLSNASRNLVNFLQQKYKDVIKFDAAKQFFQSTSEEKFSSPPFSKKSSIQSSKISYNIAKEKSKHQNTLTSLEKNFPISEDESGEE